MVIDIVGFRRHGHNEIDEPMFTQPLMYKIIKKKADVLQVYGDKLLAEGRVTAEKIAELKAAANKVTHSIYLCINMSVYVCGCECGCGCGCGCECCCGCGCGCGCEGLETAEKIAEPKAAANKCDTQYVYYIKKYVHVCLCVCLYVREREYVCVRVFMGVVVCV